MTNSINWAIESSKNPTTPNYSQNNKSEQIISIKQVEFVLIPSFQTITEQNQVNKDSHLNYKNKIISKMILVIHPQQQEAVNYQKVQKTHNNLQNQIN